MDIYLGLHLFLYPSIALSTHHRTCALEKLTNRKRRLLYSEGNSHGTSQWLTMELASLVFLQFQHGLKMANTLWLRGGVDHCFACLPRTQHNHSWDRVKRIFTETLRRHCRLCFFQIKSLLIFFIAVLAGFYLFVGILCFFFNLSIASVDSAT